MAKVSLPGVRAISASQIVPVRAGILLALAAAERARVVVEALRLGGIERGLRRPRLDRERDAGGEPAARTP